MYRALETLEPKPVIRDRYAIRFLPRELALAVRAARVPTLRRLLLRYADHRAPGARTSAVARTAAIDELVSQRVFSGLCHQVVLLGAGFDCRAHRLPELAGVPVFEVDRRETQAIKRAHVPASKVTYVEVDFLRDDAFAKLEAAGWRRDVPSLVVWEGVTNYLTEEAVLRVLSEVGRCAAGTRIVFTYIHRGVLDGSHAFLGGEQIRANVAKLGEPWTFGLEPSAVGDFVARARLVLASDQGADEYRRAYLGATSPGYAFYRLAVADRP
jgi:methyltransferase (TIGR00027 family)